ncbi:hypothetical protein VTK73DRAFT_9804 [Phialemonium thermophilum]|uniref:Uncharacterized protein n=1 Tax=Phialemonium thermophilum TaxID=223376 RepID=A0ABR3W070_9PEZI
MCWTHKARCLICEWREGYIFEPCSAWLKDSLEKYLARKTNLLPGSHFHCADLEWPCRYSRYYVCEHCLYEMSYLSGIRNEKLYDEVLAKIRERIEIRAKNDGSYVYQSLRDVSFPMADAPDTGFQPPRVEDIPQHFADQMAKNDFKGQPARKRVLSYVQTVESRLARGAHRAEILADRADNAGMTLWIPHCNICDLDTTMLSKHDLDVEIEFEPNDAA